VVFQDRGSTADPRPGHYSVEMSGDKIAAAAFLDVDPVCGNTETLAFQSGSVTLDAYEAKPSGRMQGAFTLALAAGEDPATGSFDAAFCDLPVDTWRVTSCQ
jgi:hypothetical protein